MSVDDSTFVSGKNTIFHCVILRGTNMNKLCFSAFKMWHEYEVLQILHLLRNILTMIYNTAMYLIFQWSRFFVINDVLFNVMDAKLCNRGCLNYYISNEFIVPILYATFLFYICNHILFLLWIIFYLLRNNFGEKLNVKINKGYT